MPVSMIRFRHGPFADPLAGQSVNLCLAACGVKGSPATENSTAHLPAHPGHTEHAGPAAVLSSQLPAITFTHNLETHPAERQAGSPTPACVPGSCVRASRRQPVIGINVSGPGSHSRLRRLLVVRVQQNRHEPTPAAAARQPLTRVCWPHIASQVERGAVRAPDAGKGEACWAFQ